MLTWVPVEGEADTIIYTPKYEVMKGIEDGYILPAEFVSADTDNNSLTFRTSVPDGMLASIAGVQAGQWIRVTAPMHQPEEIALLTSAVAAERPNLVPPPPPPMPEPPPRRTDAHRQRIHQSLEPAARRRAHGPSAPRSAATP